MIDDAAEIKVNLFPAHAGVILPLRIRENGRISVPRTRGGDPI